MNEAIVAFIVSLTTGSYDLDNILQAYQSNIVTPTNQPFIELTEGDTTKPSWYPGRTFDSTAETTTYDNTYKTNWQIDFYGAPARATVASVHLAFTTQANKWFRDNGYDLSVASVDEFRNLTGVIDSDVYVQRWVLRFSLYNTVANTVAVPVFASVDVGVLNADLITPDNPNMTTKTLTKKGA